MPVTPLPEPAHHTALGLLPYSGPDTPCTRCSGGTVSAVNRCWLSHPTDAEREEGVVWLLRCCTRCGHRWREHPPPTEAPGLVAA